MPNSLVLLHIVDFWGALLFLSYPQQPVLRAEAFISQWLHLGYWSAVLLTPLSFILSREGSCHFPLASFPWLSCAFLILLSNNPLNRPVLDAVFLSSHVICLLLYWVVWGCIIYQHHILMSICKTFIPKFIKKKKLRFYNKKHWWIMEVLRKSEDQRPKNAHEENMLFCVRFASVWLPKWH